MAMSGRGLAAAAVEHRGRRTDDNIADFLTKPLASKRFYLLRDRIMNVPSAPGKVLLARHGGALNVDGTASRTA